MSKTPEQMREKMAGKAIKLAGKVGDQQKQKEVADKAAAQIVAEINALCPDCCVGGGCGDEPEAPETCGCACSACGTKVRFCPGCGKEL